MFAEAVGREAAERGKVALAGENQVNDARASNAAKDLGDDVGDQVGNRETSAGP